MLKLKALNPDNVYDTRAVVKLFKEAYGDTFPAKRVYNEQFWANHINIRFRSIGAYKGKQLIAHLALQPDRDFPSNVQIALPAFTDEFLQEKESFLNQFGQLVNELQKVQGWQALYTFCFTNCPAVEKLASEVLGTQETALCPEYLPFYSKTEQATSINNESDVVIAFKIFGENEDSKRLFIPSKHMEICKHIYSSLNLKRTFKGDKKNDIFGLPSDQRAVTTQTFKTINVRQFFCNPSLMGDLNDFAQKFYNDSLTSDYCFINMLDPRCPELCEILELQGFVFSGCLPLLRGNDSIVYYRSHNMQTTAEFNGTTAKILAEYIKRQLSGKLSESGLQLDQLSNA